MISRNGNTRKQRRERVQADVVVVGAGIVGSAIARRLSRYRVRTVLLEKHSDVCMGTSKSNNAHIVCGADCPPGKIETEIVVRSNSSYDRVTEELQVPYKRIGTAYVAIKDEEVRKLEAMQEAAAKNGVAGTRILGRDEILEIEPRLTGETRAALWVPHDGILAPYELGVALCENAAKNGVEIRTGCEVKGIDVENGAVGRVICNGTTVQTRVVINAAGLFADEISAMVGWDDFQLYPRRGEFYILDRKCRFLVNHIIYPLPGPITRGATICPTIDDNVLIGPTAVDVEDKRNTGTTREGLREVITGVQRYFPEIRPSMGVTQYAGLRPAGADDFIVAAHPEVRGFINAAGIRSTGISACLGVAERVEALLSEQMELRAKPDYNPFRERARRFGSCSPEEQDSLISRNVRYGRVVCRCETVTEQEILEAIYRVPRACDLDAVKRRTRAGMGRCQGGFCTPRVMSILSRELGLPMEMIAKKGPGSEILKRPTKGASR